MSSNKQKDIYTPMRMCMVTRERLPKKTLIRIVKLPNDTIVLDPDGKLPGRGSNIKADIHIFLKALGGNRLKHALKMNRNIGIVEKEKLKKDFLELLEQR